MKARVTSLWLMLAAILLAAAAVAMTGWGSPDPTVTVRGGVGSTVESVLPGGALWRTGLRNGQMVVELSGGVDAPSWSLVSTDGTYLYSASYGSLAQGLRDALPAAMVALVLAAASWVLVRSLPFAAALSAIAMIVGAQTVLVNGPALTSSIAAVAATISPAIWLWSWSDQTRWGVIGVLAATAIAAAWLGVRLAAPDSYEQLELVRQSAMGAGLLGIALVLAGKGKWRARILALERARAADVFAVVGVLCVGVAAAVVAGLPVFLLIVAIGSMVVVYPVVRRRLATTIDQLLFGEIRGRATLEAVESERGRIARDLHDAPLQEISAVIRELDRRPDTDAEAELLRSAAGHLRRVTTELRPPVLDDLGLPAALSHVIEQAAARAPGVDVQANITPDDPRSVRAPAVVELAVFRIVQEAVDNSLRHAQATRVVVNALVSEAEVDVTIEDDGVGIDSRAARQAARNGHIGLPTMAQRAAAIGASFSVSAARPRGTAVRVRWRSGT